MRWRRMGLRWRVFLIVLIIVVVGAIALVAWSVPRGRVSMPGVNASPEQVVTAYVEAVNVRDFGTANALIDGPARLHHSRFSRALTISDLHLGPARNAKGGGGQSPADHYQQAVYVPAAFLVSGGDVSMPDGHTVWGYLLARHAGSDPWRIIDQGID